MTTCKTLILTAAGFLLSNYVIAAVYKSVDADGNVVYSDEPVGDSKPVDLPPLSTIPPPRYKSLSTNPTDVGDAVEKYQQLDIVSPIADETLRDNTGNVPVSVAITPELDRAAGHRLQYYLDGQMEGEPVAAAKMVYQNLDRGAHTVEVAVVDGNGIQVKRSSSVRFYLHRQSVNFPRGPARPTPR